MAMVKCPICNERFDREKEPYYVMGSRYVHKGKCEAQAKEIEATKLAEKGAKEKEESYRKELIDYVMQLQGTKRPHGMVLKQIKDFREMGYSYRGMKSTLVYFHEVLGNEVVGTGIGIVPFVYDEAIEFYVTKRDAKRSYDKLMQEGRALVKEAKEPIVVNPRYAREAPKRHKINMEDIE